MPSKQSITHFIKQQALSLGFDACGIAKADFLSEDAPRLERWLKDNRHGKMGYMENHFDKRLDPRKLLPGTKTVVTVLQNYFPEEQQLSTAPKISKYAYGKDYHRVIKKKLQSLLTSLAVFGDIQGRAFTDSAPILERSWAQRSGLGWVGKNGMLINKKRGSFYFIGILLLDIDLENDQAFATDHCGTCNRCVTACPTNAILPNKEINAAHCISYYTIELRDALVNAEKKWDDWVFGCDICQDVCPWNRFSKPHDEPALSFRANLLNNTAADWLEMNQTYFDEIAQASPLKRATLDGLKRNVRFVYKK